MDCEFCNIEIISKTCINNSHSDKKDFELYMMVDDDGYGLVLFAKHTCKAVFEIKFCPKCGRELKK